MHPLLTVAVPAYNRPEDLAIPLGTILSQDDEITRKLLMLNEGECEGDGPLQAAKKFSYCKQRYFQLRDAFQQRGAIALQSQKRGPKTNYRRTPKSSAK